MDQPELKVGDRLIVRHVGYHRGTADAEAVVTKVGRRWGYAQNGKWDVIKFDLQTGYEDGRGYTPSRRLMTQEQDRDERQRNETVSALKKRGVVIEGYTGQRIDTAVLVAIKELIERETA